jgi:hypothetical protein
MHCRSDLELIDRTHAFLNGIRAGTPSREGRRAADFVMPVT